MTRMDRIRQSVLREERKREERPAKDHHPALRRYSLRRIRWDRPLPHEKLTVFGV
jgi:hypothetical protein